MINIEQQPSEMHIRIWLQRDASFPSAPESCSGAQPSQQRHCRRCEKKAQRFMACNAKGSRTRTHERSHTTHEMSHTMHERSHTKPRAHVGRLHYGSKSVRNLSGHFLLYLRALADMMHDAVELREADDLRGSSDVRANERCTKPWKEHPKIRE